MTTISVGEDKRTAHLGKSENVFTLQCAFTGKVTMSDKGIFLRDGECCLRHRIWTDLPPKYKTTVIGRIIFFKFDFFRKYKSGAAKQLRNIGLYLG